MAVTLEQAKLNTQDMLVKGTIDECYRHFLDVVSCRYAVYVLIRIGDFLIRHTVNEQLIRDVVFSDVLCHDYLFSPWAISIQARSV